MFLTAKSLNADGAKAKWTPQQKKRAALIGGIVLVVLTAAAVAIGVVVSRNNGSKSVLDNNQNTSSRSGTAAASSDLFSSGTPTVSRSSGSRSSYQTTSSYSYGTVSPTTSTLSTVTSSDLTSPTTESTTSGGQSTTISATAAPSTSPQLANGSTETASPKFTYRPFTSAGLVGYWALGGVNGIDQIDLSNYNSVLYSFMFPDSQGNLVSSGKGDDSYWISIMNGPVRQKYQHIRTILSIGGYTGGVHFSSVAGDAGLRQKFVKNIHSFLDTNGFDGVDIDWEYPGGGIPCNEVSANDVSNFATLLSMLRTELGPDRHISIAVSAVASRYIQGGRNYATEYAKHVNFMGIMTYDLYGPWVANADFNAPLTNEPQDPNGSSLNVQNSIQSYISEGVSPSQLVGGLAFYGRSWSVASQGSANGLFQPCANSPSPSGSCPALRGDFHDIGECDPCGSCGTSGAWTYFALRGGNGKQSNAPLASGSTSVSNGWSYQYFTSAASATVFSPSYNGISNLFVAFDDARSIQAKASWMRGAGLGGALVWEIGGDFQGELGSAAHAGWSG